MTLQAAIEPTPSAPTLVHGRKRAHFEPARAGALGKVSVISPLGGAIGAALLLASDRRAAKKAGLLTLGASLGAALLRWQYRRVLHWQPPYRVELQVGRLEVRRYGRELHAETTIESASWPEALTEGFHFLADYLLGNNELAERLPMTSPVMITLNTSSPSRSRREGWRAPRVASVERLVGVTTRTMALVLPGSLSLDDLPAPNDDRVQLRTVRPRLVAALRFRGRTSGELPAEKRNELLFLTKCAGLSPVSEVTFAAYDAPSTLPLLRRNEVLVEVDG